MSDFGSAGISGALPLRLVDAMRLAPELRAVLRPGETLVDRTGRERQLPRWFYEVDSWGTALNLTVTPNFSLWEFIGVDVREAPQQRTFPRYVPTAVTSLAAHLEVFRQAAGTYVHLAGNGGYRSPAHRLSRFASRHCWATAANIYRIGDTLLDDREALARYANLARSVLPACWIRPYGQHDGEADDHLHLDLGYLLLEPTEIPSDPLPADASEAG